MTPQQSRNENANAVQIDVLPSRCGGIQAQQVVLGRLPQG